MAEFFVQRGWFVQFVIFTIHLDALKPLFAQFKEFFFVFPFSVPHDGCQKMGARPLFHRHDTIDHILHLLCLNRKTGCRTIGRARAGKQQTQIIVNLGHRTNG